MYKKIAVLFDDSREADRALSTAVTLTMILGSELEVFIMKSARPLYDEYAEALDSQVGQILANDRQSLSGTLQDKAKTMASKVGVEPSFHAFESGEQSEVIELMRAHDSDLLIVGLHHKGLLISRLWRSVYEFAEGAPCSILGVH